MEIRFKKIELIGVAVVMLILWLVFVVWRFESIVSIAIAGIMVILIGAISLLPKRVIVGEASVPDERLKKMHVYAAKYSRDITFLFICLLVVVVYFRILEIDLKQIVTLICYGMGLTWAGFYAYLSRRGDVA